jgi:SPP1 gp7 family putative phage head morphogenesis protein
MISRSPASRDRRALHPGGRHAHTPHASPSRVGYDPAASFLDHIVLADGLVPPLAQSEAKHYLGAKQRDPRSIDLRLAARAHRIEKLDRVQKSFFRNAFDALLTLETRLLALFGLPRLQRIIETLGTPEGELPVAPPVRATITQWDRFGDLFDAFLEKLVGTAETNRRTLLRRFKAVREGEALYPKAIRQAYLIGAEHVIEDIRQRYGPMFGEDFEERYQDFFGHPSFQRLKQDGLERVVDYAIKQHRQAALDILSEGVYRGLHPLAVARDLHKSLGGQAWKWQRLARSETALAVNAGTLDGVRAEGLGYVRWSAAAGACERCGPLDGQVWSIRDSHPEPVASTHPNCLCLLVPEARLGPTDLVQRPWMFPDPYGGRPPWTEIDPTYIEQSYAGRAVLEALEQHSREQAERAVDWIVQHPGREPIPGFTPHQSAAIRDVWAHSVRAQTERMFAGDELDPERYWAKNGIEGSVTMTIADRRFLDGLKRPWTVHNHPGFTVSRQHVTPDGIWEVVKIPVPIGSTFSQGDMSFYGPPLPDFSHYRPTTGTQVVVSVADRTVYKLTPPPGALEEAVRADYQLMYDSVAPFLDTRKYIRAGHSEPEAWRLALEETNAQFKAAFERLLEPKGWRYTETRLTEEDVKDIEPVDLPPENVGSRQKARRAEPLALDAGPPAEWGPRPEWLPEGAPWPPKVERYDG